MFVSCSSTSDFTYYNLPLEFRSSKAYADAVNGFYPYLKGRKIFIDPGHGGEDRKNVGSLGLATEADVNLRVALHLKYFLEKSGASAVLSREKDETVDLKKRADMANNSGADIFISIHHNASKTPMDTWTNYTSTYYRGNEDWFEFEPCNRELAQYVQRDLAYAMGNSGGYDSFDGTYTDYYILPETGIAVLRDTKIPAVLIECSFHTNPFEERRLIIDEFNKIQAWGIYKGIGRYFQNGIPNIKYLGDVQTDKTLKFILSDKEGIDAASIKAFINKIPVKFDYDQTTQILKISIVQALSGENTVRIICANKKGNHSFPFYFNFFVE